MILETVYPSISAVLLLFGLIHIFHTCCSQSAYVMLEGSFTYFDLLKNHTVNVCLLMYVLRPFTLLVMTDVLIFHFTFCFLCIPTVPHPAVSFLTPWVLWLFLETYCDAFLSSLDVSLTGLSYWLA